MDKGESGIHPEDERYSFLGKNLAHLLFNVGFPYGGASEHDYLFAIADVDGMRPPFPSGTKQIAPTLPPDASQALVGSSMPLERTN